jgi:hypothetical protein
MTAPDFLGRLAAADGLAYHFAMLDEVARRVRVLEEEHRPEPEIRVVREFSYWGDLTSTTSGFQAKPRLLLAGGYTSEELRDITEYRTYVEAALLLARKVSDVVSPRLWKPTRLEKYPSGRNEGPPFLRCYKVKCGTGGIWTRGLLVAKDAVKTCQPGESDTHSRLCGAAVARAWSASAGRIFVGRRFTPGGHGIRVPDIGS